MSAFWNFVTRMVPGTLAKAEDVNTNLDGINTGFNLVEAEIDKTIQITSSPGVTDIGLNAAARANKLLSFDVNGDIAATTIIGDWKGNHADAAGTDYEIRDVVKDAAGSLGQDDLYICITTHTSTGGLAADTANWELLVEVSDVAASAAAALVSENNAATSADFLDDRVLGAFSTAAEPTLDNDGNALLTGAQYFNTDLNRMKVYTGSIWQLNTAAAADVTIADAGAIYIAVEVEAALQEVKSIADTNKTNADASKVKTDLITVTQAVNLDTIESDTATNNSKATNVSTNITVAEAPTNVSIQSSDGTNDTIAAANGTNAGVMTTTMYDEHVVNNAKTGITPTQASNITTNNAKLTANTTNVAGAGALMDSEVDADIKTLSLPASTTISAFGRTLIDDATAAAARTTLGLGAIAVLSTIQPSTHLNDNITTDGSQSIGASSSWTPPQGFYNMVLTLGVQAGVFSLFVSSAWRVGANDVCGVVFCDGSNMRLNNLTGTARTVYYQRFDG